MNHWIQQPETLSGENILLQELATAHLGELRDLAADATIWRYYPFDCSQTAVFSREFDKALQEKEKGNQFPFVIFSKSENKLIGSTRLLYLQPAHRKLEIGWTWLHPDYWHTPVNGEAKSLLLAHCFDRMKAVRVQLKTDENNIRSRKAIEKTGARFEGILRNDMIRDDGSYRNSAYYSIIEGEWPRQ